jgi:hypothetical protein
VQPEQDRLSDREAFEAMSLFLNRYAEQAGDDLITLLGDLQLMDDGAPTDAAAWSDWISCVSDVKQRRK